jgi:hypothetical protein
METTADQSISLEQLVTDAFAKTSDTPRVEDHIVGMVEQIVGPIVKQCLKERNDDPVDQLIEKPVCKGQYVLLGTSLSDYMGVRLYIWISIVRQLVDFVLDLVASDRMDQIPHYTNLLLKVSQYFQQADQFDKDYTFFDDNHDFSTCPVLSRPMYQLSRALAESEKKSVAKFKRDQTRQLLKLFNAMTAPLCYPTSTSERGFGFSEVIGRAFIDGENVGMLEKFLQRSLGITARSTLTKMKEFKDRGLDSEDVIGRQQQTLDNLLGYCCDLMFDNSTGRRRENPNPTALRCAELLIINGATVDLDTFHKDGVMWSAELFALLFDRLPPLNVNRLAQKDGQVRKMFLENVNEYGCKEVVQMAINKLAILDQVDQQDHHDQPIAE